MAARNSIAPHSNDENFDTKAINAGKTIADAILKKIVLAHRNNIVFQQLNKLNTY